MPSFCLSKKAVLILSLFLFISLSVIIAIFIVTNQRATEHLIKATMERQWKLTEAGASNIESFMAVAGRSVVLLGQNYELVTERDRRQALLDKYVADRVETPIVGPIVTDEKGIVTANSSRDKSSAVGVNLSDRDYFQWAKTAAPGSLFITKPTLSRLGFSKGKQIILFATPIFKEGKFQGVLAISTMLELFGRTYLDIVFPEPFSVYLLDSQGTVLVAPNEMTGANIYEALKQNPFIGSELLSAQFRKIIENHEAGGIQTLLPQGAENKLTRTLATYSPIKTPDNKQVWELIVLSPESSIVSLTAPIYIQEITVLIGIFFLVLVVFVLIFSRIKVILV